MFGLKFFLKCICPMLLILFFVSGIFSSEPADIQKDIFKHIKWREIGPTAFGGRIDDIEAVADNPDIIFISAASGGIFKSTDYGTTWKAVFDSDGTALSIGDLAIAPSDPNIVWAGTGEANNRQSSSWGDGAYRSIDGGETWKNMGLKKTHQIGRIAIHPRNPDVVYVAALGHLWGPNPERGLYRTKDGGKTWDKLIFINEDTGFVDVVIEENGRVVYAAAYQRRRRGWGFVGGGPHSGLYRSMDGGETWEKLSNGLPDGDTGRIGISISKSHPNIVYVIVENKDGGIFRSENRGESWTKVNSLNPRPMYYSHIPIDPKNPNKIWVVGGQLNVSIDGGKNFTGEGTAVNVHGDHHDLWIDPNNTEHLLLGGDGGFYISYNGSKTWKFIDNIPNAQFYDIGIDTRDPYWIYGGAQDHGTYGLPSRTDSRMGITNSDVVLVAYGDAFYCVVDPDNPDIIYTENQEGRLVFKNMKTHEERILRPVPENPDEVYRFNWKCPLVMSPHDSRTLYYGGNKIFKTSDQGHSWEVISPDLTKNQDWKKLPIMETERTEETLSLNDGKAHYGTITTISESPVQAGLIYAGTDDGNVKMTKDGGKIWEDQSKGFRLPGGPRWVSCVLASHHGPDRAYACFDGHRDDDFTPYIFKTEDFGKTWKKISGGIPEGMTVNTVMEHPRNPNLLFAGTEFGLFISVNGGSSWLRARGNLPCVPIDDIIVNARDNDLVLGTHGRGVFILDDIGMLEHVNESMLDSGSHLFPPRMTTQFFETRLLPTPAQGKFRAPNPDYGALITYYLKDDPPPEGKPGNKPQVKIIIMRNDGEIIRELEGPDQKGFSRINWDLRYPLSFDPKGTTAGYFEPLRGPLVLPGDYKVKLLARSQELTQPVRVRIDPRVKTSSEALQLRLEASKTVNKMAQTFIKGQKAIQEMEKELARLKDILKKQENIPQEIESKIKDISKNIQETSKDFRRDWYGMEFGIMDLIGQLEASAHSPTQAQQRTIKHIHARLKKDIDMINILLEKEFPELQSQLNSLGIRTFIHGPVKSLKKKNEEENAEMNSPKNLSIQANLIFLYYKDLDKAQSFYQDILGLNLVLDYGFAKLFQISQTSYVGLVDEKRGMHNSSEPKSVTLSFVTEEIDEWYQLLKEKGLKMRGPIKNATRHPTRGFVVYDPEGYYLEFERFLDHAQNKKLMKHLKKTKTVYPQDYKSTSRPDSLGLQANIIWLYYKDLDKAQRFYEDTFGFKLMLDQGFTKVYQSSPTCFIGLVDEAQGLHRYSEEKAVTLSFISEQIDEWHTLLKSNGLKMRTPLSDSERIPVRAFVTYDIGDYFLEFDKFLEHKINKKLLKLLKTQ